MLTFTNIAPASWVAFALILAVITATGQIIYNAFLHPLRKVPGPLLARVSGIPSWYHTKSGNRHIWLCKLFDTYGPRVRVAPNTVLFRDSVAYRDIYSYKANVQKAPIYEAWQVGKKEISTFLTRPKREHALRRKLLKQSFTEQPLRAAEPFMIKHINRWNELLVTTAQGDQWSKTTNFANVADALVFDIMGDLSFGASFNIKEPGENSLKSMPHSIVNASQLFYPITHSPVLNLLLWLKPYGLDSLLEKISPPVMKNYNKFVDRCVNERLIQHRAQKDKDVSEQRRDMFWFLCNATKEDGSPAYTDSELHGEASTFVIAGSDTTSVTLTALMFYLTCNPMQYEKVVQEVRSKFVSAEDISSGLQLTSCIYLKACIDETMRMSPSLLSELPREVLKGGAIINGDYYPQGTIVGSSNWAEGHNEEVYGDSEIFRPERWIADERSGVSQQDINALRANLHPFAQGPTSCLGQNIAILELMITVARTLHRFDVRRAPGSEGGGIFKLQDAFLAVRDGPMVQFKRRSS